MMRNLNANAVLLVLLLCPSLGFAQRSELESLKPDTGRWLEFSPYLSAMVGVGESAQAFTASPWQTWGPVIGGRAGFRLIFGFRADLAFTLMPYSWATKPDSTKDHYATFAATARFGWGVWVDSVYLGVKVGSGLPVGSFDATIGMEWHVSDQNFFQCEFGFYSSELVGQLCGYGWSF